MDTGSELAIRMSVVGTDEDHAHALRLASELREGLGIDVRLETNEDAPAGTKSGDALTIGSLAASIVPALLPSVVAVVTAWLSRQREPDERIVIETEHSGERRRVEIPRSVDPAAVGEYIAALGGSDTGGA